MLEPDTSSGRIGLLTEQLSPRTAFWEAEMWVRPEVLRRDQIDPPPLPPPQGLLWPLLHNLNPQAGEKNAQAAGLLTPTMALLSAYLLTLHILW